MATSASGLVSTGLSSQSGTSSSGTNSFAGLGQGINVSTFVQLAEANQQANVANVQSEQTGVQQQSATLANIASDLQALKNAAAALQDPLGALAAQAATSSNSNQVTATATSSAIAGQHTIAVTSLATTSSYYTDAVTSGTTALAIGSTINISVGGKAAASVTINSSNNTLNQVASAINNQTSTLNASVITDANGARLAVVSATSGAPGNLTVTGSLKDSNGNTLQLHQASPGLNAQLSIDNVPISSTTNTVTGAINGVTLNLFGPTGDTPAAITVAPDAGSITSAISSFVTAYNTAVGAINAQYQVSSTGIAPPLLSDSALSEAQSQLLSIASYSLGTASTGLSLATLGISTNNDGTLSVNQSQLAAQLQSNYSGVLSFFQTVKTGFAANIGSVLTNLVGPAGALTVDAQGYTLQNKDLAQQITDLQAQLALQTQTLTDTYSRVNTTLQELPLLQAQLSQQLASIP